MKPNLEELNLSENNIGTQGAIEIAKMIQNTPQLKCFILEDNEIEDAGIEVLSKS